MIYYDTLSHQRLLMHSVDGACYTIHTYVHDNDFINKGHIYDFFLQWHHGLVLEVLTNMPLVFLYVY